MNSEYHFGEAERRNVEALLSLAIAEDLDQIGDITSTATIPSQARARGGWWRGRPACWPGVPVLERLAEEFELLGAVDSRTGPTATVSSRGPSIARLGGPMRSLLAMERMALNFLQRLSGIATLTARFVAAIEGTRAAIYDTRKTTPGWRALEKYAVRCGGGHNHRFGLYDAVLIKDNHLAWLESATGSGAHRPDRRGRRGGAGQRPGRHDRRGRGRHARAARRRAPMRPRHHPGRQPGAGARGRGGPASRCRGPVGPARGLRRRDPGDREGPGGDGSRPDQRRRADALGDGAGPGAGSRSADSDGGDP